MNSCRIFYCVAISALSLTTRLDGAEYTIFALEPPPGGITSSAGGWNRFEHVVGASRVSGGTTIAGVRPVRWDTDASAERLWKDSDYPYPGGASTAINNLGQIVGIAQNSFIIEPPLPRLNGIPDGEAFLLNPGQRRLDLGTLGGLRSEAIGINDAGQVVGSAENAMNEPRAFAWDAINGMRDLGTLGGTVSRGSAINQQGQIVGHAGLPNGANRAFIWDQLTGMQALPSPIGAEMRATGINDRGQVTGFGGGMFLWDTDGGMRYVASPAATLVLPHDINNATQIVGEMGSEPRAFIWSEMTGLLDLNSMVPASSGWHLAAATEINDSGQIIGSGFLNGETRAFVMTPIPEPRSIALVALATSAILLFRLESSRRRRMCERARC
jgi:probable HAF family extracellular repeat protein